MIRPTHCCFPSRVLTTVRLISFVFARVLPRASRVAGNRRLLPGPGACSGGRSLPPLDRGDHQVSQVPRRIPVQTCPALRPRSRFHAFGLSSRFVSAFRQDARRRLPENMPDFGVPSHGLSARCVRFTSEVALRNATLAFGWWPPLPNRLRTCRTLFERFPLRTYFILCFPLSVAYLGARVLPAECAGVFACGRGKHGWSSERTSHELRGCNRDRGGTPPAQPPRRQRSTWQICTLFARSSAARRRRASRRGRQRSIARLFMCAFCLPLCVTCKTIWSAVIAAATALQKTARAGSRRSRRR
jgi:hypothetical protein